MPETQNLVNPKKKLTKENIMNAFNSGKISKERYGQLLVKLEEEKKNKEGLVLEKTDNEDLLIGKRKDGRDYTVRKHRMNYFMPDTWKSLMNELKSDKAKLTANILIQTGARINEAAHIELRDIDFDRNTIRLRVVKTKARKKGEERGKPRTIPINSYYIKLLKKHFNSLPVGSNISILSDSSFNRAMQNALKRIGREDWKMYSAHNVRKTHGNWLKIMGDLRLMNCSASEICLRLGHDYNTFLRDYGSSGVMNTQDVMLIKEKELLGDLYANQIMQ